MSDSRDFLASPLALDRVQPYRVPSFDRSGLVRLDINERPGGAPDYVVEALRNDLTSQMIATYPDYSEWQECAARAFDMPSDHIAATSGADEGIRAIIDTFMMPGTALITHNPGFEMFRLAARLHGNPVLSVPFRKEGTARFVFDPEPWFEALAATEPSPGIVAIVNPSNPTGAAMAREAIVRTLQAVDCPVIVDETYGAFLGQTCVDLVDQHRNLFVVTSFSKVHGLAGLRIGMVITRPANIDGLRRTLNPYNVNRAAVVASIACMKRPEDTASHIDSVREVRGYFVAELQRLGFETGAEHANFVLVHVGDGHARLTEMLHREGVLICDRHGSHPQLDGIVRIAIGTLGHMKRVLGGVRKTLRAPPKLAAIALDMDGTLVDERTSYKQAIVGTARELLALHGKDNVAIDDACVDRFRARGGLNDDWECTFAICREHGVDVTREEVIEEFQRRYLGADFDGLITNERWLLSETGRTHLPTIGRVAVVTGRPRAEAQFTLDKYAPTLTDVVVTMEDTAVHKPDPEPLLLAMRRLLAKRLLSAQSPVDGHRAAYVGDAVDDMAAARSAGMYAVGVLGPGRSWQSGWPERLHEAGAHVVFADIDGAIAWLAGEAK